MTKRINEVFFLRPWAVKEDVLTAMTEIISRHIKGEKLSKEEIQTRVGANKIAVPDYEVTADGVARIPIYGVIAKRASMVNNISQPEGTSVEEIRNNLNAALSDNTVKSIMLDIDSPGGSVDGIAEMSDMIFEARKVKPILAYADGQMCSAAYWLGSSADKIYASKSSEVGSIGVYAVISDYSRAYKNLGVDTAVIKAGKYKAAGHPLKPFTDEDRGSIQDEVNSYYDLFVEAIARNRNVSAEDALSMANGKVYIGKKALAVGLVDGIMESDMAACNDFKKSKNKSAEITDIKATSGTASPGADIEKVLGKEKVIIQKPKEEIMVEYKEITLDALKVNRPDLVTALNAEGLNAGKEAVKAEGKAEGVKQENARATAILKKANAFEGMQDLAVKTIEENDTIEAAENRFKAKKLDAIQKEAPKAAGPGQEAVVAKQYAQTPEGWALEYKETPALATEFGKEAAYVSFKKAEAAGKVKIYKK